MDPKTGEYVLDDRIIASSGKMMLLERLLEKLFATDHKVLVSMLGLLIEASLTCIPTGLLAIHDSARYHRGLGGRVEGLEYLPHRRTH